MKTIVDLDSWPRANMYKFFSTFKNPFISLTAPVHLRDVRSICKARQHRYFIVYLYALLKAVNAQEGMRYRIEGDGQVVLYDRIHALAVVRIKGSAELSIQKIRYCDDFKTFYQLTKALLDGEGQNVEMLNETIETYQLDVVMISPIPDLNFSSFVPAQECAYGSSYPLMSTGQITQAPEGGEQFNMTLSVNHAFMDGYHVAQLFKGVESAFQEYLKS